jgi:hypothetical protein
MNALEHVVQNVIDMAMIPHPPGNEGPEAVMNELPKFFSVGGHDGLSPRGYPHGTALA